MKKVKIKRAEGSRPHKGTSECFCTHFFTLFYFILFFYFLHSYNESKVNACAFFLNSTSFNLSMELFREEKDSVKRKEVAKCPNVKFEKTNANKHSKI